MEEPSIRAGALSREFRDRTPRGHRWLSRTTTGTGSVSQGPQEGLDSAHGCERGLRFMSRFSIRGTGASATANSMQITAQGRRIVSRQAECGSHVPRVTGPTSPAAPHPRNQQAERPPGLERWRGPSWFPSPTKSARWTTGLVALIAPATSASSEVCGPCGLPRELGLPEASK